MDIAKFHRNLLGFDPWPEHHALYDAFSSRGVRGHSQPEGPTVEAFISTFVLALTQTWSPEGPKNVILAVPKAHEKWVLTELKFWVRVIFRLRKAYPKAELQPLIEALERIHMGAKVFQLPSAPDRWVAVGFHSEMPLPEWMKDRLL